MTAYENISKIIEQNTPSMKWDGVQPLKEWQTQSRQKLEELLGLENMIPASKDVIIEYDVMCDDFREIRFKFQSEPEYYVPCHLLIPHNIKNPNKTVICLQGHTNGMHLSLGRLKFPKDTIAGDLDFAVRAIQEGFCALVMDQRNFGECGGDENGAQCLRSALSTLLLGRTTIGERVWDVMRAIDVLVDDFKEYVNPDKIYVMGNSSGGTTTNYVTAVDQRISAAISSCCVCTYFNSIVSIPHCSCNYIPSIAKYFDTSEILGLIAPRKLVVVNGEQDKIFPIEYAKKTFAEIEKIYEGFGQKDKCTMLVGEFGHRFYADIAWDAMNNMKD